MYIIFMLLLQCHMSREKNRQYHTYLLCTGRRLFKNTVLFCTKKSCHIY